MDTQLIFVTPAMLGLIPIVMGLVQLAKMHVDSKWAPLLSLIFGIVGAFLLPDMNFGSTLLGGVTIGLMSSGAYSSGKKMME